MTADERIEDLLNRFGESIGDAPKDPKRSMENRVDMLNEVSRYTAGYTDLPVIGVNAWLTATLDYACYLAEIIDHMETALQTAVRLLSGNCRLCEGSRQLQAKGGCSYVKGAASCWDCFEKIRDENMVDIPKELWEDSEEK